VDVRRGDLDQEGLVALPWGAAAVDLVLPCLVPFRQESLEQRSRPLSDFRFVLYLRNIPVGLDVNRDRFTDELEAQRPDNRLRILMELRDSRRSCTKLERPTQRRLRSR